MILSGSLKFMNIAAKQVFKKTGNSNFSARVRFLCNKIKRGGKIFGERKKQNITEAVYDEISPLSSNL